MKNSTSEIKTENKMGVLPVNKLLITMSLPMMASMLIQAMYNIVDSIFVSRISENALTAVSLATPLQFLLIALGAGTSVGINAILSKALGSKDNETANKAAQNGIFLAFMSFLLFVIIGLTLVKPFYYSQTKDIVVDSADIALAQKNANEIYEYGVQYLSIVLTCSFGIFFQFVFERILTSTGRTLLTMFTQGTGAIINIILDPLFIFGYHGFPEMGVAGAAISTVIGQVSAAVFAMILNIKKNPEISISMKKFRPDGRMIWAIYKIGIPSIIMQAIGSVMNYIMNKILISFTPTAVAVFGIYYKLQSFIFMPIFGLNNGMIPIIAYNFGANRRSRLMKTWKLGWLYATILMLLGTAAFELIPEVLLSLFEATPELLEIAVPALRIIGVHFPVAGFCIVTGTLFQSLGKSVYSMITSIMRQIVVLIPAALLLAMLNNVDYVWLAFPIAEVMSAIATIFFFILVKKKVINKIGDVET